MKELTERARAQRNLNPHKPALIAMWLWGSEYAAQGGGSMDFWDARTEGQKQICRQCLQRLAKAPEERQ
jgi:hypothetical protein